MVFIRSRHWLGIVALLFAHHPSNSTLLILHFRMKMSLFRYLVQSNINLLQVVL